MEQDTLTQLRQIRAYMAAYYSTTEPEHMAALWVTIAAELDSLIDQLTHTRGDKQ